MRSAFAGRFVALTMLAGSLTAAFPIHAEPAAAAMSWRAADACAGQTAASVNRSSEAALATPFLQGNGPELEILGAALGPLPVSVGEGDDVSGCSPRRCHADFISIGCCGRFRVLGIDSRGVCTVRERCDP